MYSQRNCCLRGNTLSFLTNTDFNTHRKKEKYPKVCTKTCKTTAEFHSINPQSFKIIEDLFIVRPLVRAAEQPANDLASTFQIDRSRKVGNFHCLLLYKSTPKPGQGSRQSVFGWLLSMQCFYLQDTPTACAHKCTAECPSYRDRANLSYLTLTPRIYTRPTYHVCVSAYLHICASGRPLPVPDKRPSAVTQHHQPSLAQSIQGLVHNLLQGDGVQWQ